MRLELPRQLELAPQTEPSLERVRLPSYGRYLDDFEPGEVTMHPRGYTFERSEMRAFATAFMQCNPLYLNEELAQAHGFAGIPASSQQVFNVLLSLGVQNNSEKAMANLGYYNARFFHPVYAGDTLRAFTRVAGRRERGEGKPGIVHLETLGLDQKERVVAQYERKIMVRRRPQGSPARGKNTEDVSFPWLDAPVFELPEMLTACAGGLTAANTYFEDFARGDVIVHPNGRTITDEHAAWTYRVGNTHPLHYDAVFSRGLSGKMSGEPIVYGGLVFAWLEGLASRDVSENAVWEVGFTEGYHTQPAISGDTVAALTRILACEELPGALSAGLGLVTMQLIGVKNITAADALETYGEELFRKEGDKRKRGLEKIGHKIFEIERQLIVKRRGT
ncbi:MAG: MaoC family dehydratase N-terminal domain-containing protein [Deltaproteobacteria bacterium]|nr:MaoC family dehydratase N-terminal domain-containing protein [Deltaproteobacteria bacterium]